MSVSVITPTVGTKYLIECIKSVANSTYKNYRHIIVVDGKQYETKVKEIVGDHDVDIMVAPQNTGSDGRNGHHKYAALPYLCNTEYIILMDEDNTMDQDHIQSMMDMMKEDVECVYAMRKIMDKDGKQLCVDNFESIGTLSKDTPFVDTSCMLLRLDTARKYALLWVVEDGKHTFQPNDKALPPFTVRPNDRLFSEMVLTKCKTVCTMKYSLCYRVYANKPNPPEYFIMNSRRHIVQPWLKQPVYLCHFSPIPTNQALAGIKNRGTNAPAWMDQWQLPMVDGLSYYFDVHNGYVETIPTGATVIFTCCFPEKLPERIYKRTDIIKVLIAMEPPNYRHQHNYEPEFISHFDKVVTYCTQFKDTIGSKYIYAPFPYNLDSVVGNTRIGAQNISVGKSICCVLADRNINEKYSVLGVPLKSLDYLRHEYAKYLSIDCFGDGWISDGKIVPKGYNPRHPIEIMNNYTFTLITENNDAVGYVSEKIMNAFLAGTIPLYYTEWEIPFIPSTCYINIAMYTPTELAKYIDSLTDSDIKEYRDAIYKHRESILTHVSVDNHGKYIYTALIQKDGKLPTISNTTSSAIPTTSSMTPNTSSLSTTIGKVPSNISTTSSMTPTASLNIPTTSLLNIPTTASLNIPTVGTTTGKVAVGSGTVSKVGSNGRTA